VVPIFDKMHISDQSASVDEQIIYGTSVSQSVW